MYLLSFTLLFVNSSKTWQSFEQRLKVLSLYSPHPTYILEKIMKNQLTEKLMKMLQLNYIY